MTMLGKRTVLLDVSGGLPIYIAKVLQPRDMLFAVPFRFYATRWQILLMTWQRVVFSLWQFLTARCRRWQNRRVCLLPCLSTNTPFRARLWFRCAWLRRSQSLWPPVCKKPRNPKNSCGDRALAPIKGRTWVRPSSKAVAVITSASAADPSDDIY